MAAAHTDVRRQKKIDRSWGSGQGLVRARMAAVLDAQERVARHKPHASYELRQALVDLAAACELVADDLPRPRV